MRGTTWLWCLAGVVLLAAALLVILVLLFVSPVGADNPQVSVWPQVSRTFMTTQAGDAFMTTAVVMPEDLER